MNLYIVVYSEYQGPWKILDVFQYESDAARMISYYNKEEGIPLERIKIVKKTLIKYIM